MTARTFHVSLNVADIDAAVERYRQILGIEPAKHFSDYAKFELADPPLILSVNLGGTPGTVGHLGIRHEQTPEVLAELGRARTQGLDVIEEQNTTCCYAEADKFWLKDADGMPWEMYAVTADATVHSTRPHTPQGLPIAACCAPASPSVSATACCAPRAES
jgi:catechol 2,3-dioxygenase-like lactoylglutathione lyase family enzyme